MKVTIEISVELFKAILEEDLIGDPVTKGAHINFHKKIDDANMERQKIRVKLIEATP
jgi:hypothetical protein